MTNDSRLFDSAARYRLLDAGFLLTKSGPDSLSWAYHGRPAPQAESVLVANLVRGGDVFLSTALLPAIRASHPTAHITFACAPAFTGLLLGNPHVDTILPFGSNDFSAEEWQLICAQAADYQAAYLLQPYPDLGKTFFTTLRNGQWHLLEIMAAKAGVNHGWHKPQLQLTAGELKDVAALLAVHGIAESQPYLVLHISAQDSCKSWPLGSLVELAGLLQAAHPQLTLILVGGNEAAHWQVPRVLNLAGQTSLRQTASLIVRAAYFIGVDSLPAHLTALNETPALVLHGGTLPRYCSPINRRLIPLVQAEAGNITAREVAAAFQLLTEGRYSQDPLLPGHRWATADWRLGTTSIIILTYNQLSYTSECVASIERHTPEPHEIIFVDNGSTDGTVGWLQELVAARPNYRLIANNENRGFAAGCNQGLRAAQGDYLLLLNNDVVVTPGWLGGLLECLTEAPDIGLVGPMTNAASGAQLVPGVNYDPATGLDGFARAYRLRHRGKRVPSQRIVGFCMLFNRQFLARVGFLDEQFGSGNFEDDDYCYRAALEGYRNLIVADVFIHHFGSVTFQGNKLDYGSALDRNRRLYARKWSGRVHDERQARKILAVQTLTKAADQYQAWDLDGAISTLLDEGIRFFSEDARFYGVLAEYLVESGRYQDALEAVASFPTGEPSIRIHVAAGNALLGLSRLDEAKEQARLALLLGPASSDALQLCGLIAEAEQDLVAARSFFIQAIAGVPWLGAPFIRLGMLGRSDGAQARGIDLLEKGFMVDPLASGALDAFHGAICADGLYELGIDALREARRFYPASKGLAYRLIDLLIKAGQLQQAMSEIQQVGVRFGFDNGMIAAAMALLDKRGPAATDGQLQQLVGGLSLCMIVKDEAQNLPRCLDSLSKLVEEIIVVDTGSTDSSVAIARIFGARVFALPWTGDFSAARNYGLEQATGDWILVMDADEVIAPQDFEALRQLIAADVGQLQAYAMTTRNYTRQIDRERFLPNEGEYPDQEAGVGWTPSTKVRLFPRVPGIRFDNPIHELVEPSLAQAQLQVRDVSIPVHHYGELDSDRLRRKAAAYYEIGRQKLASNSTDLKALIELAIQAGQIGRHGEAIALWQQVVGLKPELASAYFNMGFNYLRLERFLDAKIASEQALELQPDYPEALGNLAYAELCLGAVDKVVEFLAEAVARSPQRPLLGLLLGVALCCKGEKAAGREHFDRVAGQQIDIAPLVNEIGQSLLVCQKYDFLVRLLDAITSGRYGDAETEALTRKLRTAKPPS